MTLAKTILMEPLKRHLRYTMMSGYVANAEKPVSTLIIAPAERAKSTETTKFDEEGCGTMIFNDFTSWGLRNELKSRIRAGTMPHHVVVPDMERISAKSKNIRQQILADIRIISEEGLSRSASMFDRYEGEPIRCAFIVCTTREDVSDGRSLYRKGNSLVSRFLPFTYDYSNGMCDSVLDFVRLAGNSCNKDHKESLIEKHIEVEIPDRYSPTLKMQAKMLALYTDKWTNTKEGNGLIGVRALKNLRTYLQAIAVYNNRQRVTDEEFDESLWLYHWMNFKFCNIDEFER